MEYETGLRIILECIAGLLGSTPLMLIIKELFNVKGVFKNIILWCICFYLAGFYLSELILGLSLIFFIMNIFLIMLYSSVYLPKVIKYFKNKIFKK